MRENSIGPDKLRPGTFGRRKKLGANIDAIILIKVKKFPKFGRKISRKFSDNERNVLAALGVLM